MTATATKGSTVEFHIQVPVTAKDIRTIIEDSLQELTESFAMEDATARKRVAELRKALFTDGKFRTKIAEHYAKALRDSIRADLEYGGPRFDTFPAIAKMQKELDKISDAQFEKYSQEREQQKIKDAVKMLKEQGYTVTQR